MPTDRSTPKPFQREVRRKRQPSAAGEAPSHPFKGARPEGGRGGSGGGSARAAAEALFARKDGAEGKRSGQPEVQSAPSASAADGQRPPQRSVRSQSAAPVALGRASAPVPSGVSYGYARVSSVDQDLTVQREQLERAGCKVIRAEKVSATSTQGRDELRLLLDFIREGDELVVTRVDRLARSIGDLQDVVRELKAKGAMLRATEQPINTSTAAGKAFLDMLGVFAEFETNLRRERQMEGIAKAKARGVYKGRKPTVDSARVRELREEGMKPSEIARELKVGRTTVWRALRTD